ncbi:hypothetical protein QQG74_09085 [Micromonospora sp. FIMYZ51]|uniref:hypothetical protein n=1 Tax=Micromonospora sp. FIMYZ51 TaxID=3051832 RepID=UPI00311FEE01
MPLLSDLIGECNESTIAHHASGRRTRTEALARLTANGLTVDRANELLDAPVDPALFDHYGTWPAHLRPANA